MASSDPLIGQQLANYRIEKLIGRGGMAKVYLGWDVRLRRSVAVKVIDDRFRDDPNYTERFLREARIMATWQHLNIPLVYHVGDDEGVLFFAMEYIRGQNLAQLLRQRQADGKLLPHAEVLRIGWAIAKALDYAHHKGVVHRDVTPSNVILSEDERVVLMDFGLALDVIQGTQGKVFGSAHYIAPEQARSSAMAVVQTDLYSLGVILYEMLTGEVPYDDPSPVALALKHIKDDPPLPSLINPQLSTQIEAVLLKALQKLPQDRYQNGQDLMQALEAACNQEMNASQPVTLAELPASPAVNPPQTLAEIPAPQALSPQPESPPVSEVIPEQQALQPESLPPLGERSVETGPGTVAKRSRYLAFGGLGCGLLILLGIVVLFGSVSLALRRQNSETETSQINSKALITLSPTQTHTAIRSLTPIVIISSPTSSATPNVTATPTIQITYELLLVSNKDDSLFVINQGTRPFPLAPLEFKYRSYGVLGEEWEVEFLESGECVTLWKREGRPKAPKGLKCDEVGKRLERSGSGKFWTAQFEVYYQDRKIGACNTQQANCIVRIIDIER